jgi:hypothetical protein
LGTEELFSVLDKLMPEIERHEAKIRELEADQKQLSAEAGKYEKLPGWELVAKNLQSAADARTKHIKSTRVHEKSAVKLRDF